MQQVARWLLDISGITHSWPALPTGVELCRRIGDDQQTFILINHTTQPQAVTLPEPLQDVLAGQTYEQTLSLPPRGVAVLAKLAHS
jgi:beta-galactosidase